ncbi:bile acid:sodium symporter family protein [Urbifossiella limnaea]|uniref:Sodium Bile acid symporter family protein n=1 Tax=Urbifossiella limnaea TaxID=2528023 RepID=A0A517XWV3_9BACT|nr:bile acid:sodium symporter [Urbifossiella limnaea]QDU21990.1 Sodium Bile acid symporter family protein [Urbifossiella limnaea]
MGEALDTVARLAVLVFVVASMAGAGLGLTTAAVVAPLRRGRLVAGSLVANFVIAPAVAYGLTRVVPLVEAHAAGLILLGGAAGAPFLPRLAAAARGDAAFAVGLMLLLMVGSVAFLPLALPLMIPGVEADPWPLLRPLLLTMLLPIAAGMAVRRWTPAKAALVRPVVERVATVFMVSAVLLLAGLNAGPMLGTFGSGATLTAMAFVAGAALAGYALGGPARETRAVLGVGTGQRNVAAALVIATQNFTDPGVVVMLLVATFAGLAVLLPAARVWARPAAEVGQ